MAMASICWSCEAHTGVARASGAERSTMNMQELAAKMDGIGVSHLASVLLGL